MEENVKNVVEETTQDQTEETPQIDESKFESAGDDSVIKVDLSNPPKEKIEDEQPVDDTKTEEVQEEVTEETADKEEVVEQSTEENDETPVLEEITNEEVEEKVEELEEQVADAIVESQETGKPIPENIQRLMDFMEETGGDLNDYVKLNQDYSKLENQDLLFEYYKQTKPHLNLEEINFLMEDTFSYDEEVDEEIEIKRKKLA